MQIKTETKVGAFVISIFFILLASVIYLGIFDWRREPSASYTILFTDVSGLGQKAEVKIAGVTVGWVDDIALLGDHQAQVHLMVSQKYHLYANASAEIHQDGLLGNKYIDLSPGNAQAGRLPASVPIRGRNTPSLDQLVEKFNGIAQNIEDVSVSLKNVLTGETQQEKLNLILDSFAELSGQLAPVLKKVSNLTEDNLTQVADHFINTMESIDSVARKIDDGAGVFGKLINDQKLYEDLQRVSCSFREASDAYERMGLVVDSHFEAMTRRDDEYNHKNAKGYFGVRLHTSDDWFYLFQMVGAEEGGVTNRSELYNTYYNSQGERLTDQDLANLTGAFIAFPAVTKELRYARNTVRYSYQIGRVFGKAAVRFGAFEDFFGVAVDCEIFRNDYCRWVSTMECFDFRGQNHIDDRRPHFKWLNRFFILRNTYIDFGMDDFVSKASSTPFWGFGIRFGDDDLKVLLTRFGLPSAKT